MRHRNSNGSSHNSHSNSNSTTNGNSNASMYRSGYNPSSLEAGRDTNANILEHQNNDRIAELSDQVARLKGLTIDIGNEVREQNSLLDDMGDGFSGVSNMLGTSLKRIGTMLESGGSKHMCYLVSFVVAVMVFLYWVSVTHWSKGIQEYWSTYEPPHIQCSPYSEQRQTNQCCVMQYWICIPRAGITLLRPSTQALLTVVVCCHLAAGHVIQRSEWCSLKMT